MISERIDEWEKEKIQQGIQQGVQKGIYEERLSLSLKLLEHKFPALPESFKAKVRNMPIESLGILFEKLIKAQVLEEIID